MSNIFIGASSGYQNTIGSNNIAIGYNNTTGSNNTVSGFNPADSSAANIDGSHQIIGSEMVKDLKESFSDNKFMQKYEKILSKSIDPIVKSENVNLTTAAIMKTIQNYFKESDANDESSLNELLENMLCENAEIKLYMEKLDEIKNKQNKREELDKLLDDDDIDIDIVDEEEKMDKISLQLIEVREKKAYDKATIELNKLISKRESMIKQCFKSPGQAELDNIFKTKILNQKDKNGDNVNNDETEESLYEWDDIVSLFKKYNISSNVIELITNIDNFKKELKKTHTEFRSIQNSINKFNQTIGSQLEWVSNMPDCFDNKVIIENIENIIRKYFEVEDVISLFKEYKNTYIKMMLLISFIPKEFMSKDTCSICLDNERNIVIVPCGHTCCSECSKTLTSCMVCRGSIEKKQKIFNC